MSGKRLKVAVVGTGAISTRAHIPAYKNNKDVDLVALVDADEVRVERVAKKFGVKEYYASIDELFSKRNVDAISICTPPDTHADIAIKAFKAGAHVLCEKPMATKKDDGLRMFEVSKKEGKLLMIGFNMRFRPNYGTARKMILSGRLGRVYMVECAYLTVNPLFKWAKSPWFFSSEHGGGVLLDQGPHVFDLLNYIFGDFPYAVSAHASTYFDSPVEDSCVFTLDYPGGRTGVGLISWLSSEGIENLNIHGTGQSLFISPKLMYTINPTEIPEISMWRKLTESLITMKFPNFPLLPKRLPENSHQLEIDHFVKQIHEGIKFSDSAISGVNVMIAIEAARESIKQKTQIDFSSINQS